MNNKKHAVTSLKKLDRIDLIILDALQNDGRLSNVALAEKANLSTSPCLERVKRLEDDGFIKGYSAKLDGDLLGYGKVAYIQVTMEKTTEEVFHDFKKEIAQSLIVSECHMVAGGFDYLLKVRFDDLENYRSVLADVVKFPGVLQTHTYMVIEQVKVDIKIPVKSTPK